MKTMFGMLAIGGLALVLQGCGGGGGGGDSTTTTSTPQSTTTTKPHTTTTTKIGTTTTTTLPPRTKPMSSQQAANYLNKLYKSFNVSNDTTQIGVTISMAADVHSFFGNIFCSHFFNPHFNKYGDCYKGQGTCRMSASVLNDQWMIDNVTKKIASFAGRPVGYVFNQTMVESRWAKCSYIWDGASGNLYNRGCGNGAPNLTCADGADNAWNNQCGKKGPKHTCTIEDDEVKTAICDVAGGSRPVPAVHSRDPECVFPGPAFAYNGQEDFKPHRDFSREMARQRLKYNYGGDWEGNNTEKNNEVVLDEELMMKDIWENPITAIPAILYTNSNNVRGLNKQYATQIRDDLCNVFGCTHNGGGLIPLVMVEDTQYHPNGPFFADAGDDMQIVI